MITCDIQFDGRVSHIHLSNVPVSLLARCKCNQSIIRDSGTISVGCPFAASINIGVGIDLSPHGDVRRLSPIVQLQIDDDNCKSVYIYDA